MKKIGRKNKNALKQEDILDFPEFKSTLNSEEELFTKQVLIYDLIENQQAILIHPVSTHSLGINFVIL